MEYFTPGMLVHVMFARWKPAMPLVEQLIDVGTGTG